MVNPPPIEPSYVAYHDVGGPKTLLFKHCRFSASQRDTILFAFKGTAYKSLVLPFGLYFTPHTFTKCAEAVLALLRESGICIIAYLDDKVLTVDSREQAEEQLLLLFHSSTGFFCEFLDLAHFHLEHKLQCGRG